MHVRFSNHDGAAAWLIFARKQTYGLYLVDLVGSITLKIDAPRGSIAT